MKLTLTVLCDDVTTLVEVLEKIKNKVEIGATIDHFNNRDCAYSLDVTNVDFTPHAEVYHTVE